MSASTADAIVVGAGIVGASVALELCRRGRRVAVCDRNDEVGAGTTAHSSAVIRALYATQTGIALAVEGLRTWERWPEHVGIAADDPDIARLRAVGVLFLFGEGEGASAASSARVIRAFGGEAVPLDAAGIADRFSHLARDDIAAGLLEPAGGYVDRPRAAARNAIAAARATGRLELRLGAGAAIVAVERGASDGPVRGVRLADEATIEAPVVVNAAGGWSAPLNALAGVRLPIETRAARVQYALARDPEPGAAPPRPVVADLALGAYHKPEGGGAPPGTLRTGSILPEDERRWTDPDAFDPAPDAAFVDRLRGHLAARFPGAAPTAPGEKAGAASLYDMCLLDGYPIVDRTDLPGYYVAIGTSGAWFKGAPVLGALAAELIVAVQDGHDHDRVPLAVKLPHTGHVFDLGALSRHRGRLVATREQSVLS